MKKKRCRDGVTCVVLCVACTLPSIYLYSLCGFWHCGHPYIPQHFLKMFFILVHVGMKTFFKSIGMAVLRTMESI